MKWEFCIKDAYNIKSQKDNAIKYEKELIAKKSTRN
jgi:hypothetical protein